MGKNKKAKKANKVIELPFVSVCTPTYNRRPFIEQMLRCFDHQDYPKDKLEWIIIDDGTDPIEELVTHIPQVKYFYYKDKMSLGKKRNLLHEKSKGDILVYMDDDDYYPSERISHAVYMLQKDKKALCSGCSEIYTYFRHIKKMYQFGPYSPTHATAGTFAFKRELLDQTSYEDEAALAEEKHFLKNYTIPFVQLDPYRTILVISHVHNTFDKTELLETQSEKYCKVSDVDVSRFFKNDNISQKFFLEEVNDKLQTYEPGRPEMKQDVVTQYTSMKAKRAKEQEQFIQNQANAGPLMIEHEGKHVELNNAQIKQIIENQGNKINELSQENNSLKEENERLTRMNEFLKKNRGRK
jgi:hypothetical protein